MSLSQACASCLLLAMLAAVPGCAGPRPATARVTNAPPIGVIEAPRDGTTTSAVFVVQGWAGDDMGIRAVRVFVDGELAAFASVATDRPDVTRVYPHFRHGNDRHGYEATLDPGPGPHTIRVEAIDSDGVTADLATHHVVVASR